MSIQEDDTGVVTGDAMQTQRALSRQMGDAPRDDCWLVMERQAGPPVGLNLWFERLHMAAGRFGPMPDVHHGPPDRARAWTSGGVEHHGAPHAAQRCGRSVSGPGRSSGAPLHDQRGNDRCGSRSLWHRQHPVVGAVRAAVADHAMRPCAKMRVRYGAHPRRAPGIRCPSLLTRRNAGTHGKGC